MSEQEDAAWLGEEQPPPPFRIRKTCPKEAYN